jgi:hypothetical protein
MLTANRYKFVFVRLFLSLFLRVCLSYSCLCFSLCLNIRFVPVCVAFRVPVCLSECPFVCFSVWTLCVRVYTENFGIAAVYELL